MNSSQETTKISAAIVRLAAEVRSVGKSGNNTFDRYTYAKLEDYMRAAHPALAMHGLCVLTSVDSVESLPDRTTQKGGIERCARVMLSIRLVHESGEWIEGKSAGEGQDRADKAVYKAITGARKYGLASMLSLATTDDPEDDEQVGQSAGGRGRTAAPKQTAPPPPPESEADWRKRFSVADVGLMEKQGEEAHQFLTAMDEGKWKAASSEDVHRYLRHCCHKKGWTIAPAGYKLAVAGLAEVVRKASQQKNGSTKPGTVPV